MGMFFFPRILDSPTLIPSLLCIWVVHQFRERENRTEQNRTEQNTLFIHEFLQLQRIVFRESRVKNYILIIKYVLYTNIYIEISYK